MSHSEQYVVITDCTVVSFNIRSYHVECPHFPVGVGSTLRRLFVPLALFHREVPVPDVGGEPGPIVVLKRFVDHNKITEGWTLVTSVEVDKS